MTPDQARLQEQASTSGAIALWRALVPLRSVACVLQTGAHPDDETSALLARLSLGDGLRVAFACATRGEGGQNAIGTEAGPVLGVLRTAEMARAAETLGIALHWLNQDYDGAITDFGFSKSGEETAGRWGREVLLERLVRTIRAVQPDIVLPTFLDVPGQHGHHRAVTITTEEAFFVAADPAVFPEHMAEGLVPWQAQKFYLPAWGGGGGSYDDEVPPPPETVAVAVGGWDPMLGATYDQAAQWSRAYHRSQGMGRWVEEGPRSVPLHRKHSLVNAPDADRGVLEGLPGRLADLAEGLPAEAGTELRAADAAIDTAFAAYPDTEAVSAALAETHAHLAAATQALGPDDTVVAARLRWKERQVAAARIQAAGLVLRVEGPETPVTPGRPDRLSVSLYRGTGVPARLAALEAVVPEGWSAQAGPLSATLDEGAPATVEIALTPPDEARPVHPWRFAHDRLAPTDPVRARLGLALGEGPPVEVDTAPRQPVWLTPPVAVGLAPDKAVRRLDDTGAIRLAVELRATVDRPIEATLTPAVPPGWRAEPASHTVRLDGVGAATSVAFSLLPEGTSEPGRVQVPLGLTVDGRTAPAQTVRRIAHPHIQPQVMVTEAAFELAVVDVDLDRGLRVGYVEGGSDTVADWIEALGAEVTRLGPEDLTTRDLGRFDTIVVGIMAYGTRDDLHAARERLHAWIEAGGNLVTLYNRPWDRWDPDRTPPRRLEVGKPSLRWRVTDQTAEVTVLAPDHPLLNRPNRIGPADWEGWVKERGLYFAKSWEEAYRPLLSMADPGEAPHKGSLLSAEIGRGRHSHVCLILHHQMNNLVPGAFRLMANLITPTGRG